MDKPAVSVIVAAFNAENYLCRCLDSILSQTLKDWECIVVDDGSTDQTGEIADSFSNKDPRFHIIHQSNKGVSVSRQVGIDASRGEFMIHVDSDDWIDVEMLENMYRVASRDSVDMVFCDFIIIHPGNISEYRSQRPVSMEPIQLMGEMLFDLYGSLCNKLIRKSRLDEYNIRLIQGMNISEDQYMVLRLLSHPIKVSYIERAFYHYDHTQNSDSLCNSGLKAADLLLPLELISSYTDISPVQDYFDRAVFHIAFEYLYEPKNLCPDYPATFKKFLPSIRRANGFPFRDKLFILSRIYGINIPLKTIKQFWKKLVR